MTSIIPVYHVPYQVNMIFISAVIMNVNFRIMSMIMIMSGKLNTGAHVVKVQKQKNRKVRLNNIVSLTVFLELYKWSNLGRRTGASKRHLSPQMA